MSTLEDHPWNDGDTKSTSPFEQGGVVISKRHHVERAKALLDSKVLYQTAPMVEADTKSTPENHVAPFDLRTTLLQSKAKAAVALGKSVLWTLVVTISTMAFCLPALANGHAVGVAVTVSAVGIVTWAIAIASILDHDFRKKDEMLVEAYATKAPRFVMEMLEDRLNGDEIVKVNAFMVDLYENHGKDHADARRRAVSTIAAIGHAHAAAISAIGAGDRSDVDRDTAVALLNTIDVARKEIAEIDRQVLQRDSRNAVPISREFSTKMAQLTSGAPRATHAADTTTTGNAKVDFVARSIRKAIEMDPEMVDDNGNRIDALIERILPDLLERHREASQHARVEDLKGINDNLDEGIEMIRVSLDEGLARMRTRSAERLRTQIDFLKLRRGTDVHGLEAVQDGADRPTGTSAGPEPR